MKIRLGMTERRKRREQREREETAARYHNSEWHRARADDAKQRAEQARKQREKDAKAAAKKAKKKGKAQPVGDPVVEHDPIHVNDGIPRSWRRRQQLNQWVMQRNLATPAGRRLGPKPPIPAGGATPYRKPRSMEEGY
jgi:hypothetical protein